MGFFIKECRAFEKFARFWKYVEKFKNIIDLTSRTSVLDMEAEDLLSMIR